MRKGTRACQECLSLAIKTLTTSRADSLRSTKENKMYI